MTQETKQTVTSNAEQKAISEIKAEVFDEKVASYSQIVNSNTDPRTGSITHNLPNWIISDLESLPLDRRPHLALFCERFASAEDKVAARQMAKDDLLKGEVGKPWVLYLTSALITNTINELTESHSDTRYRGFVGDFFGDIDDQVTETSTFEDILNEAAGNIMLEPHHIQDVMHYATEADYINAETPRVFGDGSSVPYSSSLAQEVLLRLGEEIMKEREQDAPPPSRPRMG